jgi:hypothetical protein
MKNAHSWTSMQGSSRDRLQCGGLLLELCIEPPADDTEDLRQRVEQWPVGARKPILMGTVCLPFAASFLLDGIVQLLRGDGPKLFLGSLGLVVLLAGAGYALWQ